LGIDFNIPHSVPALSPEQYESRENSKSSHAF